MKKRTLTNLTLTAVLTLTLAACSSTKHHGGADDMAGADAMNGANATGAETTGAYAEGAGGGGFQPEGASCHVPTTAGAKTDAYYFEYDKSDVHPDDISRLKSLGGSLSSAHNKIRVVGNTDNRGSREYNLALGYRRANAVSSALQQAGVAKQQITTTSNGAEKPISFGSSDSDYQCNRRVDVVSR